MASQVPQLHLVIFPLMAQGHMIPMVDFSRLLAQRGVIITIVTTPHNAARFRRVIDRDNESGLEIRLLEVKFPCKEAGLPEGCENFDMLPKPQLAFNLYTATAMMQEPVEKLFKELTPKPNCIISDLTLPWTINISRMFHIPRISFHVHGCFSLLCLLNLRIHSKVVENVASESEYFLVPGLPDCVPSIEITKAQIPGPLFPNLKEYTDQMGAADRVSYGAIMMSCEELEAPFVNEYKKAARKDKIWCVGPTSLCNNEDLDKAQRGTKSSSDDAQRFVEWLDSWDPHSVVYVCLGSLCNLIPSQLIELGLGLEASEKPFIWAIRGASITKELEKWFFEYEFEERTKARGLLIRGWAPQVLILSHLSVGGFITHCGWSSILEGISAGMPMVTWPLFGDQFFVQQLVVKILKIGVQIGVHKPVNWGEEEKTGVLARKKNVKEAIDTLMEEGKGSQERRERVRKLGEIARRAVEEGGSSYVNITMLIQDIMNLDGCAWE